MARAIEVASPFKRKDLETRCVKSWLKWRSEATTRKSTWKKGRVMLRRNWVDWSNCVRTKRELEINQTRLVTTTLKKRSRHPISSRYSINVQPKSSHHLTLEKTKVKGNDGFEGRETWKWCTLNAKQFPPYVLGQTNKGICPFRRTEEHNTCNQKSSEED